MTRVELEARKIFGQLGRIPRKRKKQMKKAMKKFLSKEIQNSNWDTIDLLFIAPNFKIK